MPDDLDVVQHPTLGPLKFPKDMPYEERNGIIANMVKGRTASQPGDPDYAVRQSRASLAKNVQPVDLPLSGAERWWNTPTEDAQSLGGGATMPLPGRGPKSYSSPRQSLHSATTIGGTAVGAPLTAAGLVVAPEVTIPTLAGSAAGGVVGGAAGEYAGEKLGAPTLGQDVGSTVGSIAGGYGAGKLGAKPVPLEQQNAAAQKALDPGWGRRQQFQKDLAGSRPYLGGQGVKNVADLQEKIPGAKTEIYEPAQKQFNRWGEEPVQGPDGPTTYNKLEARRQEISAQLQGVLNKDPAAVQTIFQQGKNLTSLAEEQTAIESILDEKMRQNGVNYPVIRNTYGSVKGIENQVSGTNTLSETPQRYGLGKMSQDLSLNPMKTVKGVAAGAKDIVSGRPLWNGKPTDVGVAEGLQSGAPKPSFETTTYPQPIGPLPAPPVPPPYVPPAPTTPVGGPPPLGFPATMPDTMWAGRSTASAPTWEAPGRSVPVSEDVSRYATLGPGQGAPLQPTAVELPDQITTPGRSSVPVGQRGLTDAQMRGLPSAMRSQLSNPPVAPGSYSPGAAVDVTSQGAPLPSSTPPISIAPPTFPPVSSEAGVPVSNTHGTPPPEPTPSPRGQWEPEGEYRTRRAPVRNDRQRLLQKGDNQ